MFKVDIFVEDFLLGPDTMLLVCTRRMFKYLIPFPEGLVLTEVSKHNVRVNPWQNDSNVYYVLSGLEKWGLDMCRMNKGRKKRVYINKMINTIFRKTCECEGTNKGFGLYWEDDKNFYNVPGLTTSINNDDICIIWSIAATKLHRLDVGHFLRVVNHSQSIAARVIQRCWRAMSYSVPDGVMYKRVKASSIWGVGK
jgi:hypothetical protein